MWSGRKRGVRWAARCAHAQGGEVALPMANGGGGDGYDGKLSQEELLTRLSPPPFDQRNTVPANAVVDKPPKERWWRTDSPPRTDQPVGHTRAAQCDSNAMSMSDTRGTLGLGKRTGPGCYQSQYQCGSGTSASFDPKGVPPAITGYSGHIPGKYAGNIVGGTFYKANEDARAHLATTSQAQVYPGPAKDSK